MEIEVTKTTFREDSSLIWFRSKIGSGVGVWMGDGLPKVGSIHVVELEVNNFEIEQFTSELTQANRSACISVVNETEVLIEARVGDEVVGGLIELDLGAGSLSIESNESFHKGDWVRLTTSSLYVYPCDV